MRRKDQYIESDNSYYTPSTDPSHGTMVLVVFLTILSVILTTVLAVIYYRSDKGAIVVPEASGSSSSYILVATNTPTPVPPLQAYQNPVLYPASAVISINPDAVIPDQYLPSWRGLTQNVFQSSAASSSPSILNEYSRENPIYMEDPLYYAQAQGIFTFRGNNFRNSASFGYTTLDMNAEQHLTQEWEYTGIGSRLSSTMTFEWTGVAWTGQPLVIKWPDSVKAAMNIYESKLAKADLTEVIIAGLDGKIHFLDIDDGTPTRDPINVGASIKGTPALDPRGYPLIYVGQTDENASDGCFGMYIYSLINGQRLYYYTGRNDGAYRVNWHAFDSSPLVDANTDTLIWPCENGIVYTFTLNTNYTMGSSSISVTPQCTGYKYIFNDTQGAYLGVESSIAVYGNYGYFTDNCSNLICLDLNTMQMVWCHQLGDDTDITPVIDEENTENGVVPYIYVCTEVDNQGGVGEYSGAAYTYKINGLTGEEVWSTSQPCYTYNGETSDTDQTGGCLGNIIVGRGNISNLVIFSYSMTNGLMSGNMLVAYDKATGIEVWRYNMNIYSYSSPVDCYDEAGNAYIVIGDSLGQIHLVDGSTGSRIAYMQTTRYMGTSDATSSGIIFDASPVVYGNMIIIGCKSGSVFGIRIG